MNKIFLALLFFSQILQAAEQHALAGTWTSENSINLEVKISDSLLTVQQCSQDEGCLNFKYKIQDEKLFIGDRKVGDLFPYSLIAYDSNTQVTEMLKLRLMTRNSLEYTYSYSNMDGDSSYQKAVLNLILKQ